MSKFLFTSEAVTEGHPDKVCDQISDAIVDYIMGQKLSELPRYQLRAAVETGISKNVVFVFGEVRSEQEIPVEDIVTKVLQQIGYGEPGSGFNLETCSIVNDLNTQSADIALGVDASKEAKQSEDEVAQRDMFGAGDQGMVFGYACNETEDLMPAPIYYAQKLAHRMAAMRHDGVIGYILPDGKTQVTFVYEDGKPVAVDKILISTQHQDIPNVEEKLNHDLYTYVVEPVFEESGFDMSETEYLINPTGRFVIGGPEGDAGLTGRKIIVDTYGGMGRHGGGAFSGKDCTKVDRSAAYAARWVAKNVVAAGLADRCEVQIAYAIGVANPVSVMVDTFGTEKVPVEKIEEAVMSVFDLRPYSIILEFDMFRPIYSETSCYGHFGRAQFPWEGINKVDELQEFVKEN